MSIAKTPQEMAQAREITRKIDAMTTEALEDFIRALVTRGFHASHRAIILQDLGRKAWAAATEAKIEERRAARARVATKGGKPHV